MRPSSASGHRAEVGVAPDAWHAWVPLALVLAYPLLLPVGAAAINGVSIGLAAAGLVVLALRGRALAASPSALTLVLVFCALWLPMVMASVDALDPGRAWEKTGLYVRFGLSALFIGFALREPWARRRLRSVLLLWYAFLTVDASIQAVTGFDLLGHPYIGGQLRGVFYPRYQLGLVLTILAPLAFDAVAERARAHWAWWLALVPVVTVVLLTLHRNSWVMLLVAVVLYAIHAFVERGWRPRRGPVAILVLCMVIVAGVISTQDMFRIRLVSTASALFAETSRIDEVLGQRPDIWRTAIAMFESDPLDGVGPRGFRGAYPAFAAADDYWMHLDPPQIPAHPHQFTLEILAETGILGLVGVLAGLGVLGWRYARLERGERLCAAPWLMCVLIAMFPTNVSKAFYGHFSATLVWWLLGIGIAMVHPAPGPKPDGH